MKFFLKRLYQKLPVILFDSFAIVLAWYSAFWFRFNLTPIPADVIDSGNIVAFSVVFAIQLSSYYIFKVYRGLWRYASVADVWRIIKSALATIIISSSVLYSLALLPFLPRSILPLYAIILVAILCSGRLFYRMFWDRQHQCPTNSTKRVLVVGAGAAGEGLVRELNRLNSWKVVGFVDDSPSKNRLEIHGVRVLGKTANIKELCAQFSVDMIFIAIPSAKSATMRRIVDLCNEANCEFRTLPGLSALVSGQVHLNALRPVNIEDLLGRDEVVLEWDKIHHEIQNKIILVTGGGGSIGSELCRQLLRLKPKHLCILDHSEYNLYQIEAELTKESSDVIIQTALLSVTDETGIESLMEQLKPSLVFHAAAFKHVPMLEDKIRTAVLNNIIGTQIVAQASSRHKVDKFVLISTDKAVNPTNIMGTSKRVAELYCQNLNEHSQTQFITVRFGNVLGSAGSVIPLFQKQLEQGGPITVTHPDITRFFMTIPEASQLILQAMANGSGGEIFVLDMGEPIKITYLAEQMIRLSGKEPGRDVEIVYTGLRPGEKLYEELFHESEQLAPTNHDKLFKARFRYIEWEDLTQSIRLLSDACEHCYQDEMLIILKTLVPESKLSIHVNAHSMI